MSTELPFDKAIRVLGGQAAAGKLLGASQQSICVYSKTKKPPKAEWCATIERETRDLGDVVLCSDLRPDLFVVGYIPPEVVQRSPRRRKAA